MRSICLKEHQYDGTCNISYCNWLDTKGFPGFETVVFVLLPLGTN